MKKSKGQYLFAGLVGLVVATYSYLWITNPEGREERALQTAVVEASREVLKVRIGISGVEIVDALAPQRKVGKVYVFPEAGSWSVSGYYRRGEGDRWHPYLMLLNDELQLLSLKIQDGNAVMIERAAKDPLLEISP